MDIVVKGRNVEVPDHFRVLVSEKLSGAERFGRILGIDVELYHERNPRQSSVSQRVEITCQTVGAVIRAEAVAADFRSALDVAVDKLLTRLRRASDRRRDRPHDSVRLMPAAAPVRETATEAVPQGEASDESLLAEIAERYEAVGEREDLVPGRVVRVKDHEAKPMSVEDALFRMELVGHDFYLFHEAGTGTPAVVYRRKGYDYGLIRLTT